MGRHSSPGQWSYYRSVAGWALPWIVGAIILGLGIVIGLDALGSDELTGAPAPAATSPSPTPEPSAPAEPSPTPKPRGLEPDRGRPRKGDALVTEGVTVQVLNGTLVAGAGAAVAERLSGLGFDVVAVGDALKGYESTTVFWTSPGGRRSARSLGGRMGWEVARRPANLSDAVDVHVVVGADEA